MKNIIEEALKSFWNFKKRGEGVLIFFKWHLPNLYN